MSPSPPQRSNEEIEQLAASAFTIQDAQAVSDYDLGATEYVREIYDLDPEEFHDSKELREAMSEANLDLAPTETRTQQARALAESKGTHERQSTRPYYLKEADERLAAANESEKPEQLAADVLNATDIRAASGADLTAVQYLRGVLDVDPGEYNDTEQLRVAVSQARSETDGRRSKQAEQLAASLSEPDRASSPLSPRPPEDTKGSESSESDVPDSDVSAESETPSVAHGDHDPEVEQLARIVTTGDDLRQYRESDCDSLSQFYRREMGVNLANKSGDRAARAALKEARKRQQSGSA